MSGLTTLEQLEKKAKEVNAETVTEGETEGTEGAEEQTYEPNYSYSVLGEEKTFDDRFKPVIKTKEDEDFVRGLHEKADGLDHYKDKFSRKETEFDSLNDSHQKLNKRDADLEFLKKTNQEEYYKQIGVDPYQYALDQMEREDMDDDQKKAYDDNRQTSAEAEKLKLENERLQNLNQEQVSLNNQRMLTEALNTENVKTIKEKVPDFEVQVREVGIAYFTKNKKDMSFEDAVNTVASRYKHLEVSQKTTEKKTNTEKTRIANVTGSSGSPTDRTYKSLDDLKKVYNEKFG